MRIEPEEVLEQHRIAAELGIEDADVKYALHRSSSSVMPSTGVAITWMSAVAYIDHTNSGSWNQPCPGARSLCTVAMKFTPVKIEQNPSTNAAITIRPTAPPVVVE